MRGAVVGGLPTDRWLFLNIEPRAVRPGVVGALREVQREVDGELCLVLEVTERALLSEPAALLELADEAREAGWLLALDDVGVEPASLALLPLLRPDVVKLDLRLVQGRTTVRVAEIVTAVSAEAERLGAVVLAEGVETPDQADLAAMMGATLGQGYLFGRPAPLADLSLSGPAARVAVARRPPAPDVDVPFELVEDSGRVRRGTKPLLTATSRLLERQALAAGDAAVVLATFQRSEHYTPTTSQRYEALAHRTALTATYAAGLDPGRSRAVREVPVSPSDPLVTEWDVVVLGPHVAGALLSRDLGDTGADEDRRFDFVVTYDREVVVAAARSLVRRLPPAPQEEPQAAGGRRGGPAPGAGRRRPAPGAQRPVRRRRDAPGPAFPRHLSCGTRSTSAVRRGRAAARRRPASRP